MSNNKFSTARLASKLIMAYVSRNAVAPSELPSLITRVYDGLDRLVSSTALAPDAVDPKPDANEIRASIRREGIVSFVDGKVYKTLRRHLRAHGLHAQSYRDRYGLPSDYPMIAPDYAERRSAIARQIGLGRVDATVERERTDQRAA